MAYSKTIEAYENQIKALEGRLTELRKNTGRSEEMFSSRLLLLEEELISLKIVLRRLRVKQKGQGADP